MGTLMDGPMRFYQLERFLGGPPHNLQMESCNFRHILSWEAKSDPTVPTYYRVLYTNRRNWKTAKQCSNITQLSCNLTDDFKEISAQYSILLQSFIGTEVFNSSILPFVPFTDSNECTLHLEDYGGEIGHVTFEFGADVAAAVSAYSLRSDEKLEEEQKSLANVYRFFDFCRGLQTNLHLDQNVHASGKDKTFLGPAEVNISSCLNCINVTIKLPTSHFRKNEKLLSLVDIYDELDYEITLKTIDREHKRPPEKTTNEIFNTVIEELYPNRNYCVSVMVAASLNKHSIPSAWKCITADSVAQQAYHPVAVAGAVCLSLILAVALKCMHAGGYILQNKSLPRTLVFIRTLAYSPWTFESEEIGSVEIIYKEVKKKANESSGGVCDEDDSDDSDSDAISNHNYTRRDIISRVPDSSDTPNAFVQYSINSTCDDSSSQASEDPDTDLENFEERELDTEEDKNASSELLNPFSEVNCNCSRRRNSDCFTINLKTVLLGTSEENMDSSAALLSSQEGAADWQCTRAFEANLDDRDSLQKPRCRNGSREWQNSSHSSDESDSSDSDVDEKTEYIRR